MQSSEIEALRAEALRQERAGRLDDADRLYWQLFTRGGADAKTRHHFGMLRLKQGRAAEALEIVNGVLAASPASADLHSDRGLILHQLARYSEALEALDRALTLNANLATAYFYRGNILLELGALNDALASFDRALSLAPGDDEAWFRRGNVLWRLGRPDVAFASFEKALAINPRHFGALLNRGMIFLAARQYEEALGSYQAAEALVPGHPFVLDGLAGAVLGSCDFSRWPRCRSAVIEATRRRQAAIAPMTFLVYCDDAALRRDCAELATAQQVPQTPTALWQGAMSSGGPIRIAYLSADFRQHATAELAAGLFEQHDRGRFEVTAISFGEDDASPMRERLVKAFDHFEDVAGTDDLAVVRLLHERGIDIAIDLKGHTSGARPGILAHRPAPLQVNYLGYPGTSGAPWMDYIIADAIVLPFDRQPFYSEAIVHLPHAYQPNDRTRPIAGTVPSRVQLGLPEKGFVFCCFNAAWKITPEIFDIWMRLVNAVPRSVLWLFADNDGAIRNLKSAAKARGVAPQRLIFAPRNDSAQHLARHGGADLFLDTLPYGAHTTASDALWAGLPLVTCLGREFDGRVAASLLKAVGLPELIADNLEDYEKLALALARDPARLAALRKTLAGNRQAAPLFDTARYCRNLESAFVTMLERARSGQPPQSFAVADTRDA
jgi:predicted O-linked N-acetylglucosamine transferase (SPINDLY family)